MYFSTKYFTKVLVSTSEYYKAFNKNFSQNSNETLVLLNQNIYPVFANSVDPDQVASEDVNGSGSAPFVIQYVTLYHQPGSKVY